MANEILKNMSGNSSTPEPHGKLGQVPSQTGDRNWRWSSLPLRYWVPNWQPGQYPFGTVTLDTGWLMVSNKETAGRPAPQPSDDPEWSMADIPIFATNANTSVVYSGHQYTFLKNGWVDSLRVWIPELSATTHYRFIVIIESPSGAVSVHTIEEPVLTPNDWTYLGLSSNIVLAGTKLTLIIDSLNSGSDTNISGGWEFNGTSNTGAPATSGWNRRTQDDTVRISKTDLDTIDRSAELEGVTIDSVISFVQTSNNNRSIRYRVNGLPIDNTTYMTYPVIRIATGPEGEPVTGEACTTDIDVPIAQSTQYVQETDTWNTQPDWATVTGFLEYDGAPQGGSNDGFGIDVRFQEADISPDWDLMALTGSSSGSQASALQQGAAGAQAASPVLTTPESTDIMLYYDISENEWKITSLQDIIASTTLNASLRGSTTAVVSTVTPEAITMFTGVYRASTPTGFTEDPNDEGIIANVPVRYEVMFVGSLEAAANTDFVFQLYLGDTAIGDPVDISGDGPGKFVSLVVHADDGIASVIPVTTTSGAKDPNLFNLRVSDSGDTLDTIKGTLIVKFLDVD